MQDAPVHAAGTVPPTRLTQIAGSTGVSIAEAASPKGGGWIAEIIQRGKAGALSAAPAQTSADPIFGLIAEFEEFCLTEPSGDLPKSWMDEHEARLQQIYATLPKTMGGLAAQLDVIIDQDIDSIDRAIRGAIRTAAAAAHALAADSLSAADSDGRA